MGTTVNYTNEQYAELEKCVNDQKAHQNSTLGKAKSFAANVFHTAGVMASHGAAGILTDHPGEIMAEQKAKKQFATENMTIGACADKISQKYAAQNALNQRITNGLKNQ